MTTTTGRQRIAVIGGGVGAMTTVFALTRQPDWRERYEFDIYQLGWRLGGKGASGRDAGADQRIQEHGLHVWLGFYDNAFHVMQQCYAELNRPPGTPLATWQDAFHKHSRVVFEEKIDGQWSPWVIDFPTNDQVPGHGDALPTPASYLHMLMQWLHELLQHPQHQATLLAGAPDLVVSAPEGLKALEQEFAKAAHPALALIGSALGLSHDLAGTPQTSQSAHHQNLHWLVDTFRNWLERRVENALLHDHTLRHLYIGIDLALAVIKGLLEDGVIAQRDFNVINDRDLRQWLIDNGANPEITAWSAPIQAVYDLVFAYRDGDTSDPASSANLEAGTGMRGVLRMLLTYKGAYCWLMQAGMGDTVFGPYYQVLSGPDYQDNIRFHFFHRALALHSADGQSITSVRMDPQVRLRDSQTQYQPLVDVKGLPCWPSEPLYDQLNAEDAQALQQGHIDLESWWSSWRQGEQDRSRLLRQGDDFDQVLLGIPPSAAQHLFGQDMRDLPQWARWDSMIDNVATVQTQAIQLWLEPDLEDLGWTLGPPLLGGFSEPLSTWADMSHLIPHEDWPPTAPPRGLAYFTGPFRDAQSIPPATDHAFPQQQLDRVKATGARYFQENIGVLWPDAVQADGTFRSGLVESEYWRCNIDPTERYVQSVVNSTRHRLAVDGSGFANLFLTGDWVQNHINAGCVEAATIGGLRAARAISGADIRIAGEESEQNSGEHA